jgi:poly-gamma-glutamate synthesis protein (capsule biosynthesis protein)
MNPANIGVITAAGIDCCALANNHVRDWGNTGLIETLSTLDQAGVRHAGAGRDEISAAAPAVLAGPQGARFLVFSFASPDAGAPRPWAAQSGKPGVNLLPRLSPQAADEIGETIRAGKAPGDIVIASIHWGSNWGHQIPDEQAAFAHRLVESSGVDIVHGHSSHHARAIDVHRGKLILYGCGDLINDYEGISGYEDFRGDLVLMYFPTVRARDGTLVHLEMVPLQIRNMRLNHASRSDAQWLAETLNRACRPFGTHIELKPDNVMTLGW